MYLCDSEIGCAFSRAVEVSGKREKRQEAREERQKKREKKMNFST